MTQEQLAAAVDLHTPAVSRIESGKLGVSITMVHALADALGVLAHELFTAGAASAPGERLDAEEQALLTRWRSLGERERGVVRQVVAWAASASVDTVMREASESNASRELLARESRRANAVPLDVGAVTVSTPARTPTKPR